VTDPVPSLLLSLAVILIAAKVGSQVARRLGQPAVLGELLAGAVMGNAQFLGFSGFEHFKTDQLIDVLARVGVILLLFQVGLEATVAQMVSVGLASLLVAILGVIGPFVLGWAAGAWLLPNASVYVHIFLGAALTATSVGITARVLKDLGQAQSKEARIILGASVIDDVLGLVILAVVTAIIAAADAGAGVSFGSVAVVIIKAGVFLFGALIVGAYLTSRLFPLASRMRTGGVLLASGLAWCFLLAWLASAVGLAPIVGAFAAGLILEDLHTREFTLQGERTLPELIEPIASFLVPIFFVLMGLRIDLSLFARPGVLALAAALTCAAIIGKQMCAFGVFDKELDRLSIGIGMIPRGEVGLIFANVGLTLVVGGRPLIDRGVFSAVVVMVIVTTVIKPPALRWSFTRAVRLRNPRVPPPKLPVL
jgi:Kef-type K+ transport system membrane component KefB